VLTSFAILCPKTVEVVRAHGCYLQLEQLVRRWLASLFCCGYEPEEQSFEAFCLFLDAVLAKETRDPHGWLGHVALSVLLLNASRMLQAAKAGVLHQELNELERHIPVSDPLLELLAHPLEPRQLSAFTRMSFVPFGMLCGWSSGLLLAYDMGLQPLPFGALCSLGCFIGGVTVWNLGPDPGYGSLASLFKNILADCSAVKDETGPTQSEETQIPEPEEQDCPEPSERGGPSDGFSDVEDFLARGSGPPCKPERSGVLDGLAV